MLLDDVVAVLRMCQDHDDPARALEQLARFVLAQGRCASVAIVAGARVPVLVAAIPNAPAVPVIAKRALESGAVIGPVHLDGTVELAVAVRCAALTIGAISCRWLDAPPMEPDRAAAWLDAVAVACAPCIQAVADRLDPPALPLVAQELLGGSAPIEEVRRTVARAADAPYPVLIEGESGVGKELVARAIHHASRRRTRSFAALNCAALPDDLAEAELFGHARGAFTGALVERRGLFEEADGGVLFLDEVGELSVRAQAKLLRALQEGEIRRIGETHHRRVDVRVVAATNRALAGEVEKGRFRRDLWYRLDVIHLRVPALRERPDDVPLLARAFWQRASERVGSRAVLGPAVLAALARYDWPGNVRELQNVIAALAVAARRRGIVPGSCLPDSLARLAEQRTAAKLDAARRGCAARYVRSRLATAGGHRGRAASELGLTRQGLVKLLERLGLDAPEDDVGDAVGRAG
jgi:DNA-binding NtrC family response regulator